MSELLDDLSRILAFGGSRRQLMARVLKTLLSAAVPVSSRLSRVQAGRSQWVAAVHFFVRSVVLSASTEIKFAIRVKYASAVAVPFGAPIRARHVVARKASALQVIVVPYQAV
jgi:hypothetical protein